MNQLLHPLPLGLPSRRALGLYRLADPKIALASLVPMSLGAAFAFDRTGSISVPTFLTALAAIFAIEVGKNAVNDLCDFTTGTDSEVRDEERSPFSGGKRVLVEELLTETQVTGIAVLAFAVAAAFAAHLSRTISPVLIGLGMAGVAVAVAYSAPPFRLAARGLGELAVFAVYGPGLLLGTMALLSGDVTRSAVRASVVSGLLIAAVLLLNEMPDERADRVTGKRTLVVRLGRDGAITLVVVLFGLAFTLPLLVAATDSADRALLGAMLGLPFAGLALRELRRAPAGLPPIAAQRWTLLTYVASGVGAIAALALG